MPPKAKLKYIEENLLEARLTDLFVCASAANMKRGVSRKHHKEEVLALMAVDSAVREAKFVQGYEDIKQLQKLLQGLQKELDDTKLLGNDEDPDYEDYEELIDEVRNLQEMPAPYAMRKALRARKKEVMTLKNEIGQLQATLDARPETSDMQELATNLGLARGSLQAMQTELQREKEESKFLRDQLRKAEADHNKTKELLRVSVSDRTQMTDENPTLGELYRTATYHKTLVSAIKKILSIQGPIEPTIEQLETFIAVAKRVQEDAESRVASLVSAITTIFAPGNSNAFNDEQLISLLRQSKESLGNYISMIQNAETQLVDLRQSVDGLQENLGLITNNIQELFPDEDAMETGDTAAFCSILLSGGHGKLTSKIDSLKSSFDTISQAIVLEFINNGTPKPLEVAPLITPKILAAMVTKAGTDLRGLRNVDRALKGLRSGITKGLAIDEAMGDEAILKAVADVCAHVLLLLDTTKGKITDGANLPNPPRPANYVNRFRDQYFWPTGYDFLTQGTVADGPKIIEVRKDLHEAVHAQIEHLKIMAKEVDKRNQVPAHSHWSRCHKMHRCVRAREYFREAATNPTSSPNTACEVCIEEHVPCIIAYLKKTPVVLPLPEEHRIGGSTELAYYVKNRAF